MLDTPLSRRIICALDVPTCDHADRLTERLEGAIQHFKIGHQLQFVGGLDLAKRLVARGHDVFLDVKLHDIPNTVASGIKAIADLGVGFVTVHAYPQTMEAAVKAAEGTGLRILGVSILTSMSNDDLVAAGYSGTVDHHVVERARQARDVGVTGLVCSPSDLTEIRASIGSDLLYVTPGIRPEGSAKGDQKRVETPKSAFSKGADYLVIGRPIAAADDPNQAAKAILASVSADIN